ncbi:MAG: hypothetical protein V1735_06415 [Nanoarchaeota archaeon]
MSGEPLLESRLAVPAPALETARKILTLWVPSRALEDIASVARRPIEYLIVDGKKSGAIYKIHALHVAEAIRPYLNDECRLFPHTRRSDDDDDLTVTMHDSEGRSVLYLITNRQAYRFYNGSGERPTTERKIQGVLVMENLGQRMVAIDEVNRHRPDGAGQRELSDVKVRFYLRDDPAGQPVYSHPDHPAHFRGTDRMKKVTPFLWHARKQLLTCEPGDFRQWVNDYFLKA